MAKSKAVAAAPALQGDIPGRLAGKIAVVTGAAGNLGGHIVTHYLAEGATVVMTGRTPDRTKAAADALIKATGADPSRIATVALDGGDIASVRAAMAEVVAKFGRIDILVNNAAFQMTHERFEDIPDDEWVMTFDVNITAIFRICQRALPSIPKGGSIINTSSVNSDMPKPTLPDIWFIYRSNPAISFWDTRTLVEEIARFPYTVSFAYTVDETNWMADLLLPEATDLVVIERLRYADDQPIAHDVSWLPADIARPLLGRDLSRAAAGRQPADGVLFRRGG